MNQKLKSLLQFLLFFGVGVVILYLVYQNQSTAFQEECALKGVPLDECSLLQKVIDDFRSVNYFWILLTLVAFTISNISRAIRWNMLIHPLGYRPRLINSFGATILMYFANLGFPRLGEIVRPGTLSKYENIPMDQLLGTSVVDRMMDVISILIVTLITLLLEYENIWSFLGDQIDINGKLEAFTQSIFLYITMLVLIIGGLLFYLFRQRLANSTFFQKIIAFVRGMWEGVQTIGRLNQPALFIFHSLNIWIMYYLMTYLCMQSFAPTASLPLTAALLVFVMGGWGIIIPSPGGMGTYHFLAGIALAIYGVGGDEAFSFANISFFSIQIGSNILIGLAALIALPMLNKNYHPTPVVT